MDCKAAQKQIELYLDDEVTLSDRRELETHLEQCPDCQASLDGLRALGEALRQNAVSDASSQLRSSVRASLKDIAGEDKGLAHWAPWLSLSGGAFALMAALIWGTFSFNFGFLSQSGMSDEIVAAHIRSLLVDHVVDVRSTDTHIVKPWFTGKLDFSPRIKDLSGQGFPLIGGRLEYIRGKTGSALVYKRRAHIINVFTVRSENRATTHQKIHEQGFSVVHWFSSGLEYWIVSDLNENELQQFADLYRAPGSGKPVKF